MRATYRYTEEQALLRTESRRWLGERCAMDQVRRLVDDPKGDDPSLWKELAELGFTGLVVPAAHGGSGLGATELAVLCEEAGRALLPAPILPVALASVLVGQSGSDAQRARWLPEIASGGCRAVLAHVEPSGEWTPHATTVVHEAGRLRGEKHFVWGGPSADAFLVPVREGDEVRFAWIAADAADVEVEPEAGLDGTRRSARLRLDGAELRPDDVLPAPAADAFARLLPWACTALAAEMAGGADALLEMTAAYARTREQFGKVIGSFQAVKHPLANVLIGVEQVRSLVYAASTALDEERADAATFARMAKAHASEVYGFAANRAVQLHGGYGFTIDCDAHLYMKRALVTRPAFGDAAHHRRHVAAAWIDARSALEET